MWTPSWSTWDLVSWPVIEPGPPALEAQSCQATGPLGRSHSQYLEMFIEDISKLILNSVTGFAHFLLQAKPIGAHLWRQVSAWLSSWWAFSQCVASDKSKFITPAAFGKSCFFSFSYKSYCCYGSKKWFSHTLLVDYSAFWSDSICLTF